MARKYFNWKLAGVLIIALAVLSVTAYALRRWHRERRAEYSLETGNKAYIEHKWDEAARSLGRHLAVKRDDVPVLLKYADAQLNIRPLRMNNIQQAIAAYRAVLRIERNNSEAALKLVEMYLQMKMPGEAQLIASRTLEAEQSPKLRRLLAMALAAQRKFKESADELKSIINENPEQVLAYEVLGRLIEQRPEDFAETPAFWFNEAVNNNPSSALAYTIRAAFHLRSQNEAETLVDLKHAEKLDLSDSAVHLRLAEEFIQVNQLDKAEQHLTEIQKSDPANPALWQILAQLALKSQSKEKMYEVAERGLKELSFQPWDFMPIAAELYIRSDKLELADNCISTLREKEVAIPTVTFLEGLIANRKGQVYEAVKCWNQAIELGNNSPSVRLSTALALSNLGDKQSAIRQLRTLISEQPYFLSGRINLARLLTETGNWDEAAEHARIARQISPGNLEAALLYIHTQSQLLAANQTQNDAAWQRIENELASIDEATGGKLEVKLLQIQLAIRRSHFGKAENLLSGIRQNYPQKIEVDMMEIELLTAQNKNEEAILKLENVVETYSQSLNAVKRLAVMLAVANKRQNCEDLITTTMVRLNQPSDRCELGLLLADLYDSWDQNKKSYQLLTGLNENLPANIPVKRRLLRCEKVTNNSDLVQQLINEIKSLEGESGWQWRYEQARVWSTKDNFNEYCPRIISLLKENLLANPDDQNSRLLLAATYEKTGNLQLAASIYLEALNRSPRDIRLIIPAVAALYKANEYDRADEILHRVSSEKLTHPELKKLELQSHLRRGELRSASEILESFLANDPNDRSACLSLALLNIRQNRFTEANELLTKLKIQEPNSLTITAAQVELSIRQNNSAEAISLCDETVKNLNNAFAYMLRAKTCTMLDRTEQAEKDLEYAAAIEPNNVAVWAAQSDFYRSLGRLEKATESIRKAMSIAPENPAIQKRAISLFLSSNEPSIVRDGKNILDEAQKTNPEDVELRLYRAQLLLTTGTAPDIEQATSILLKITEDQPKTRLAWALLAEITLKQGYPSKAMDITLRGLVHLPNDKTLLLLKARSEEARSPVLAIPTLKALLELDPTDADNVVLLANTYIAAGDYEKSIDLLKKRLADCGQDTDKEQKYNTALAVALYKSGNKDEAEKKLDSLLQSSPNDPTPLLAMADVLKDGQQWTRLKQKTTDWHLRHPDDTRTPLSIARNLAAIEDNQARQIAMDILRMVLRNNSDCVEAMRVLAMLLQATGRTAESAVLYQQILEREPDDVIAINNFSWILCQEQGKHRQALELAQLGLQIAPDYIDLIDTRGVVYYQLGEFEKAAQDFNRCLKLYPPDTPSATASYLHLGKALEKLGQKDKAVENLKKALDLNTKTGGLSEKDFAEAQRLLEELAQKKGA